FGHLVDLFSLCYDKGSRIVGMIEERLGEAAFLDFIRIVYQRHRYGILRVADFQRELEEYTGQSWEAFFRDWLHGPGLCDWCVEKVKITHEKGAARRQPGGPDTACKATILLHQKGECTEQTVLGIALDKDDEYCLRIPILPQAGRLELPDVGAV